MQSARLRPGRCEPFAQASPQANFCHRDRGHRSARPAARGAKAPQRGRPNPGMSTGSGRMPPRRLRRQPWPRWRAQRGRCTRGRSAWAWPATSPIADQILARPPAHGKRGRRLEADVGAPQRAQLPVVGPGNQGLVSSTRLQHVGALHRGNLPACGGPWESPDDPCQHCQVAARPRLFSGHGLMAAQCEMLAKMIRTSGGPGRAPAAADNRLGRLVGGPFKQTFPRGRRWARLSKQGRAADKLHGGVASLFPAQPCPSACQIPALWRGMPRGGRDAVGEACRVSTGEWHGAAGL